MKICVIGATGKTGLRLVQQGLEKGYEVTGFVRDQSKMTISHPNLTVIEGDVLKAETLELAVSGQDVVFCALGADGLAKTTLLSEGTRNIISSMEKNGLKKLVVLTVIGAHESWKQLTWFAKLFFIVLLRNLKADHERQEDIVRASGLDYVIVRPGQLSDGKKTGKYLFGTDPSIVSGKISRADVADFMLVQLEEDRFWGKTVAVT